MTNFGPFTEKPSYLENNQWIGQRALRKMTDDELQLLTRHGGVDCQRAERELRRRMASSNS